MDNEARHGLSRRDFLKFAGGVSTLALLEACGANELAEAREVKEGELVSPITISKGLFSNIDQPQLKMLANGDEYKRVLEQILKDNPAVDPNDPIFTQFQYNPNIEVAVLYALGQKHTPHYSANIIAAQAQHGAMNVQTEFTEPFMPHGQPPYGQDAEFDHDSPSQPYHLAVFPRVVQKHRVLPYRLEQPTAVLVNGAIW